jgi:flagellar FliL protein
MDSNRAPERRHRGDAVCPQAGVPMSAAPAAEAAAPPAKGKKKLIIMVAAAVLVLGGGGGAAMVLMKKKVDPDVEVTDEQAPAKAAHAPAAKHDPKAVPVFVPLDPFTVNLADRNAERFAQVGVTLEIEDTHIGDQIKAYMPAIRNNILMTIADRTAVELMGRDGKARLAERIRRAASRGLGVEVDDLEEDEAAAPADADTEAPVKAKAKKKKKKVDEVALPIKAVHFSNIIIQ